MPWCILVCISNWEQNGTGMVKQSPKPIASSSNCTSFSFLVAFQILLQVLHVLRELTMKLQMRATDAVYAYKQVEKVISTLRSLRSDSTTEFRKLFSEALRTGRQLYRDTFQLTSPRFAKRQQHRKSPPSSAPEKYYRIALYNEFCHIFYRS